MVVQAYLLLGDVQFLDIEYHLLFKPVRIDRNAQGGDVFTYPFLDDTDAAGFARFDALPVRLYFADTGQQVGNERLPLLRAERIESRQRFVHGIEQCGTLPVGYFFRFAGYDLRHLQDGGHQDRVHSPALLLHSGTELFQYGIIGHEQFPVHVDGNGCGIGFYIDIYIDLAALHGFPNAVPHLILQRSVSLRYPDGHIELLAVERAYLHRDFPLSFHGFRLAVAGHRFYHRKAF